MTVYVYFIANGHGSVKIGCTAKLETRVAALAHGSDTPLTLVRSVEGGRLVEAWLHKRFAEHRLHGEWFVLVPEMLTVEPGTLTLEHDVRDAHLPAKQDGRAGTKVMIGEYKALSAAGMTQSEIALLFGVSRQAVNQAFQRFGLKAKDGRYGIDTSMDDDVEALADAGLPVAEIAVRLGMSGRQVRSALKRLSINPPKPQRKSKYEAQMREMAGMGLSLSKAARLIGIYEPQASHIARKMGITFTDGRRRHRHNEGTAA